MSKYDVQYVSASKGGDPLNIEDMHSSHLSNAFKKTTTTLMDTTDWDAETLKLIEAMKKELESRGAMADVSTGVVTWPQQPDVEGL